MIEIFSTFKLTQLSKNVWNENEFRISNFDIFGSIHLKHPLTCYQQRRTFNTFYSFITFIVIS